jgi:hypothetical protein
MIESVINLIVHNVLLIKDADGAVLIVNASKKRKYS